MQGSKVKLSINIGMLACLLAPPVASALSPQFPAFVRSVLADRSTYAAELERLRLATPLWSGAIEMYSTALFRLGVSANEGLGVVGKEGWIFLGNIHAKSFDQSTHRQIATSNEVSDFVRVLQLEVDYAARRGIPMLFVVAPSQGTIYPDKFPEVAPGYLARPSTFDMILEAARPLNLPIVDVRPALKAARTTAETYSSQNSHWTGYGGWVAWQEMAKWVAPLFPGIVLSKVSEQPEIEYVDANSEAASMFGVKSPNLWSVVNFDPALPDYQIVKSDGTIQTTPGQTPTGILDLPRLIQNPDASSPYRALVFRDSQGDAVSPYIQASFAETYQVNHHVRAGGLPELNFARDVDTFKPDLIIYVMTERYFFYPLGDIKYWEALTAFDIADSSDAGMWPAMQGQPVIEFSGDPSLNVAQPIRIPAAQRKGDRLLKLNITSGYPGHVYVSYQINGETHQDWYHYGGEQGQVFVPLPETIDGDTVWTIRDVNQAPMTLESAEVRTID